MFWVGESKQDIAVCRLRRRTRLIGKHQILDDMGDSGIQKVSFAPANAKIDTDLSALVDLDDLFAGAPPLASTRLVISDVASGGNSRTGRKTLMVLDVKRAFLYGNID